MAQKLILVDGVGEIPFYKRKGISNVRIRINGYDVRVTLPPWMPYKAAVMYVQQKADWISQHRTEKTFLDEDVLIGKQHRLRIKKSSGKRFSARITDSEINVSMPYYAKIDSKDVQKKLEKYSQKALLIESEDFIIPQVRDIAKKFNATVNTVEIKNLKSRWGSCSSNQDLAFSLFLVQLPWECIDYVIIHELAHTKHMNHSKHFWNLVEKMEPNYKAIRKSLKHYSPHIFVQ